MQTHPSTLAAGKTSHVLACDPMSNHQRLGLRGELPPKPKFDSPCNNCGLCCQLELCKAAELAFPEAVAPCPALRHVDGKALCGLVLMEVQKGLEPVLQRLLGIGTGCSMRDEDTTDEEVAAADNRAWWKIYRSMEASK